MHKYLASIIIISFCLLSCGEGSSELKNSSKKGDHTAKKESVTLKNSKKPDLKNNEDYNTDEWDELTYIEDGILIDLRYAQTNNFVKKKMYNCARCFLRPEVAEKLLEANRELAKQGYKIKVLDCYRPRPVQEELWKIMPDEDYVAAPWKGSMHNRGIAVDLTIVDKNNVELNMGTPFDFFGEEAHFTYLNLPEQVLENRRLLKNTMEKHGFQSIRTEWWHYSMPSSMNSISDWQWHCN